MLLLLILWANFNHLSIGRQLQTFFFKKQHYIGVAFLKSRGKKSYSNIEWKLFFVLHVFLCVIFGVFVVVNIDFILFGYSSPDNHMIVSKLFQF